MKSRDSYHHGDLRRALLEEAAAVLATDGVEGLSLRGVAARLGVSHAAPYHHFPDKDSLVRAVAYEGLAALDRRMEEADEAAGADPLDRLLALGVVFVLFTDEQPGYYAAFQALSAAGGTEGEAAAPPAHGDTWGRLMGAVVACQTAGRLPQGDPVILAVNLWSLVHGLAGLWRSGPLRRLPQARQGLAPFAREVLRAALPPAPTSPIGSTRPQDDGGDRPPHGRKGTR